MRRTGTFFAGLAVWAGVVGLVPAAAGARSAAVPSELGPGRTVHAGAVLRSHSGRWTLWLSRSGALWVADGHRTAWSSRTHGSSPTLTVRTNGDVVLAVGRHTLWSTNTTGAGRSALRVSDGGVLTLTNRYGTAWSSAVGNRCRTSSGAHHVRVSIKAQRAVLCAGHQQVLVTPVTTGASALGNGTPTGSWQVYAKTRNTTLYPAAGGAYHVKYWMPYSGPYGLHDSSWQHFAYGSAQYRTKGSHGCVHLPGPAMARLYQWAPVGTRVTVSA